MIRPDGAWVPDGRAVRLKKACDASLRALGVDDGWLLIGLAWCPPGTNKARLRGIDYEYAQCAHPAGPAICWCRKPLPGLVLESAARHGLALQACVMIGDAAADVTMARRLGMSHLAISDSRKVE
jgi:beta-phosphoglucomutase-like phosphatase (HAD superfamily)